MTGQRPILKQVATGIETELSGELIAGRSADSGLVLAQASRRHARITTGDAGAWVEDLGSTNGTYVNDRRTVGRTPLSSGDRVRFDLEEFEFQLVSENREREIVFADSGASGLHAVTGGKKRGVPIALIGAVSFAIAVVVIFLVWWHDR